MGFPKVCIVILNWNKKNLLRNCLNSIQTNTTYPKYEKIVVDNGSTDGSVEMIKKEFPSVRLIRNRENLGYSKGFNPGMKQALEKYNCDYVFLLNNDIKIIQRDWLEKMVEAAQHDDKVGIVGCKVIPLSGRPHLAPSDTLRPPGWGLESDISKSKKITEVDSVDGAAFMIKKDVIEKIGLLDEGFSPYHHEETDYFIRTKKSGYKVIYNPKTKLIHECAATFKEIENYSVLFVDEKNAFRLALLNYPLSLIIWEFMYWFLVTFLKKKNPKDKLTLINIKIQKDFPKRAGLSVKACLTNIKNLREIYWKRKNRTMKIWY